MWLYNSCSSAQDVFACLVATDVNTLQTVNVNVQGNGFFGTFQTVPVIDGKFIRDSPTKIIQYGRLNGV
jgi:predicted lipoprotein